MNPLLVRCEATPALGTGHAMRCLALAQEWSRRGGRVVFAMVGPEPSIVARLRAAGVAVEVLKSPSGGRADALETAALVRQLGADWLVLDGPDFGTEWEAAWPAERALLRIDDNGLARVFRAELVLNQNLGAAEADYPRRPMNCRCLLGPDHALLRPEFINQEARTRGSRIVVTLGGSDPALATERVLAALLEPAAALLAADFVIGAANPRREALQAAIEANAPRLRAWVAPTTLPELFASARFAVSAGGSTLYELSMLRTPVFVLCTAENQRRTCERFAASGAAHYAGWHGDLAPTRLAEELVRYARAPGCGAAPLVDGRGAARVVDVMIGGRS